MPTHFLPIVLHQKTVRLFSVAALTVANCYLVPTVSASTSYGVSASGEANYSVQTSTGAPNAFANKYTTGAVLQQTSYTQANNYGGQTSISYSSGNVQYNNSASAFVTSQSSSYGQLHEGIQASSNNPASGGGATASAFLEWVDTITFVGAPIGTAVTVQLTNEFDGSIALNGNTAPGTQLSEGASLFNNQVSAPLSNVYTTSQPVINVTQTALLNSTVGSSLTLQEQLTEYISGSTIFSGTMDLTDTSDVYLTVLTPGVSLVSASGANYSLPVPASSTTTPEPSALFLLAGGLVVVGTICKKQI